MWLHVWVFGLWVMLLYWGVVAILPPPSLPKKGICCLHFRQHHDICLLYNIFYNTTPKYINPGNCMVQWKKLVHQSVVHKLLPKNYHKESLITSRCCIFISFYYPTSQFEIQTYHHHHHHVPEGLGVFPVPWSSRWSWSLHLFLGRPMFLRPFGLYCSACFGSLFMSILCTCCSHFFWYCFISFTMFCAPVFCLIHW